MNKSISNIAQMAGLPAFVSLSQSAVVDITGPDAAEFFQAQVCNDLRLLSPDSAQLNGYCHPKGRLLALFTVFAIDEGYRLILPLDIVEGFVKRLSMFVMRAKVVVQHRADLACLGVFTQGSIQALPGLPDMTPPASPMVLHSDADVNCVRWFDAPALPSEVAAPEQSATAANRFVVVAPVAECDRLLSLDNVAQTENAAWRWADVLAGIPSVSAANIEQFVPQMMNLQFLNGLSFKKGCYPGQEIVARMQYLGKLKRHMRAFRWQSDNVNGLPEIGAALSSGDDAAAGRIVDAVSDATGGVLLAVVKVDTENFEIDGQSLEPLALPYSMSVEETA